METIIEEMIMEKTLHYIFLFKILFIISITAIVYSIVYYAFEWLGRKFPTLVPFGSFILYFVIPFCYPQYSTYPYIASLYAARGEANKCLDLLRLETLKDPIKTNYSSTYGSCTAILRLSDMACVANHAAAEREIDYLARDVAAHGFMGTTRMSSSGRSSPDDDLVEYTYASLHCTNSWGGIAQWIAKRQRQ
ncbi:hypothetical protein K457DRAFT_26215 [Linnemannia elongata AG-77]|uniref:Uncharacterized protein n=1 Tax=Linnemannia elongata AG-77 TaxID=1314771 RepID=A0A197JCP7_9FUNG|nr:hypothetical protein K457DRAFT_26215 [Linnemannia elongata AG-77]